MAMNALRVAAKESKIMKFVLGGFIFLAVGGLVFTDINGYFRGGLPNTTVARVGDVEISISEFDNGLRGFLQQAQITPKDAYDAGLVNAYLQSRIDVVLDAQATDDLNIRIGNETIAGEIKKVFANATRDEIEASLRARGMSEARMASIIQDQIRTQIIDRLPGGVSGYMPTYIIDAINRADNEQRTGAIYTFPAEKLSEKITVSDAEVQSYYDANKAAYAIPAEYTFVIGKLTLKAAAKTVRAPSDADVRAEYDARINDFTLPETRSIEQIALNDPDIAQQVYERALKGASLKAAAKELGADVTTFRPAVDYERNGLPDELSNVAFDAKATVGDVLPPVKTLIGWHVMKITKVNASELVDFSSVKSSIRDAMIEEMQYDALYNKIIQAEEMVDSGKEFSSIAKDVGLKTQKTKSVTRNEVTKLPKTLQDIIAQNPSVGEEMFALNEGMASYPVELDDGGFIVVGVQSLTNETYKPIKDVSKDIRETIKSQKIALNASEALDDVVKGLNGGRLDDDSLKSDYNAKRQLFKNVKQDSKKLETDLIFNTSLNEYNARINDKNNVQVIKVSSIKKGDSKSSSKLDENKINYKTLFEATQNQFYRLNTNITVNNDLLAAQYGGE